MSYGKWKALHPTSKVDAAPVTPARACEICGKEIITRHGGAGRQRKYTCSATCEYERTRKRARENYHKRKMMLVAETGVKVCEVCGKVIPEDRKSPYTCSDECRDQRHRERVQRNYHEKKVRMIFGGKI